MNVHRLRSKYVCILLCIHWLLSIFFLFIYTTLESRSNICLLLCIFIPFNNVFIPSTTTKWKKKLCLSTFYFIYIRVYSCGLFSTGINRRIPSLNSNRIVIAIYIFKSYFPFSLIHFLFLILVPPSTFLHIFFCFFWSLHLNRCVLLHF